MSYPLQGTEKLIVVIIIILCVHYTQSYTIILEAIIILSQHTFHGGDYLSFKFLAPISVTRDIHR